jgi:hypothetical protein
MGLVVESGGDRLPGFLREKINYIRVPCLDPENIRILLYQIMEHKVPVYKA